MNGSKSHTHTHTIDTSVSVYSDCSDDSCCVTDSYILNNPITNFLGNEPKKTKRKTVCTHRPHKLISAPPIVSRTLLPTTIQTWSVFFDKKKKNNLRELSIDLHRKSKSIKTIILLRIFLNTNFMFSNIQVIRKIL